jgi:hypothetical protein
MEKWERKQEHHYSYTKKAYKDFELNVMIRMVEIPMPTPVYAFVLIQAISIMHRATR